MKEKIIEPTENSKCNVFPVAIKNVKLSGFLGKRMEINRKVSIPSLYKNFEKYGTVNNFRIVSGEKSGEITKRLATDSDLYKWIEGVSFDLQNTYNKENEKLLEYLIKIIGKSQEKSGYLNTNAYLTTKKFDNLKFSHELYCGGHLIQSAIAHFRSSGKDNFLNIAIKWADYICKEFGKGKLEKTDGHPEVEMAFVELYRTTKEKKYLEMAKFFLEVENPEYWGLPNIPFIKFKELEGHAVRMLYLSCGATDYYSETGDKKYKETLLKLWNDLSERKIYITGGVGSRYDGETFGYPYELPNLRSYCESCASIASMMWQYRMFLLFPESKYFDIFETTLYNGFLSGISFDGEKYFYVNPLASRGNYERKQWYGTTCCPPNIQRMIASLPGYFYSINEKGIYINLYGEGISEISLFSGEKVKIIQKTKYPFEGKVEIDIALDKEKQFSIFLRIPSWSKKTKIKDGKDEFSPNPGYYEIKKIWKGENKIIINFDISPSFYISHPEIESTKNCIAIKKGPIVYCLESIDNPKISLFSSKIKKQKLNEKFEKGFFDWVPIIYGEIMNLETTKLPIYENEKFYPELIYKKERFKAIPYFLWANRGKSKMVVWIEKVC